MEMHQCQVCGKLFASSGPRICPACIKRLDRVYEKARGYLRDNPNASLNAKELAEAIDEDVLDIEVLIAEGRFERDLSNDLENMRRQQLLSEFQKSLSKTEAALKAQQEQKRTTYGKDRHGKGIA
jgi:predicted  nucleic acid-binding Zn-ribbon protein